MAVRSRATEVNRSAGVLVSAQVNTPATHSGTAGRMTLMLGGSAARCWRTTLSAVGPVNGGCPANISYKTHVPVDYLVAVSVAQRVCDLASDLERFVQRELLLASEPVPEGFTLNVRHHIVEEPCCFARVVEGKDMGVAEARAHFDLAKEPLGAKRGC